MLRRFQSVAIPRFSQPYTSQWFPAAHTLSVKFTVTTSLQLDRVRIEQIRVFKGRTVLFFHLLFRVSYYLMCLTGTSDHLICMYTGRNKVVKSLEIRFLRVTRFKL